MNLSNTQRQWLAWGIIAVVLASIAIGLGVSYPVPPAPSIPVREPAGEIGVQSAYLTPIYVEHGGKKLVVESGGEIELQSGSTCDIQSGTFSNFGGNLDIDGTLAVSGSLTLDGFDVADTSGNTEVDGTLGVTGTTTLNGALVMDGFDVADTSGNAQFDGTVDITGTLQYGANDLHPLGHSSSGLQIVYGTSSITGTATAAHGLTTVTWALCTLGEDPTNGAGDAAYATVAVSGDVVTVKVWQDDFVTAATETGVVVHWLVIGTP